MEKYNNNDYAYVALGLLLAFLIGLSFNSEASDDTVNIVEFDFETREVTTHEITFEDNEGTIVSVDDEGNIDVRVIQVED